LVYPFINPKSASWCHPLLAKLLPAYGGCGIIPFIHLNWIKKNIGMIHPIISIFSFPGDTFFYGGEYLSNFHRIWHAIALFAIGFLIWNFNIPERWILKKFDIFVCLATLSWIN
jgi:hypothetical protein